MISKLSIQVSIPESIHFFSAVRRKVQLKETAKITGKKGRAGCGVDVEKDSFSNGIHTKGIFFLAYVKTFSRANSQPTKKIERNGL